MNTTELTTRLGRTIRRGRVLTAAAQLAGYDTDGLGYKSFRPDAVVIPADADELVELLRSSSELGVPVTIRGAGTSLSGGPVAAQGGVVVHTSSLRKVRHVARDAHWCEAECSVSLNQLDAVLAPHGLFYPPDPSSGPVCTLGGNVAMNAGGAHCFRYGVTSNYVLGMEAVMLDGSVHRFGGPAGGRGGWREDWKRLMVGSEGTLAAFTRFWLRLLPRPEKMWTYRATFPDLKSAERAIHALALHASFPVAIELMDPRCVAMVENSPMAVGLPKDAFLLVTEIDGPSVLVDARAKPVAELMREAGASGVEYSDDEATRKGLWKARKVAGGLMGQLSPDFLVQDAVIPKRALAELLQLVYDEADAAGLPAVNVFHAGDGNLHPNFLFNSRKPGELEKVEAISKRLMQRVVEVGGTLSGEHGIGNDKTAYMSMVFGETTLKLQLATPRVFNPNHQLNPLKVFASRRFGGSDKHVAAGVSHGDSGGAPHGESVASVKASRERPPFEPLFDAVDGVLCGPATMTGADVRARAAHQGFRFPLLLDEHLPLSEQIASSGFAPASSRFGPYCDNVLGMNWRLPSGRVVRIGERVVKSTTGYDLLRFLLHARGNFGEPVDFVIRLRPDCGTSTVFVLAGRHDQVQGALGGLLATCWLHWFDSIDVLDDGADDAVRLRIALNCPAGEVAVYDEHLRGVAREYGLNLSSTGGTVVDGCPDFAFKTTSDRALGLARDLIGRFAEIRPRCVVLGYQGVVHGYLDRVAQSPSDLRQVVGDIVRHYSLTLGPVGGDWQSRHVTSGATAGVEATWVSKLEQEFASA